MSLPTPPGITPQRHSYPDTHGKNSGAITRRQLWVIHTAECPLAVGRARSVTEWGNGGYQPRASWQKMIDPATVVSWIPMNRAAWHAAPANRISIGYEQSGYASHNRARWLQADALAQIDLLAQEIVRDGIPANAVRRLSRAEITRAINGDATVFGLAAHGDIAPANRTDPGAGFPWDVLIHFIRHYHPGITATPPTMLTQHLKRGDTGPEVRLLQRMLNGLRKAGLTVDGSFGPATEAAVVAAHKAWGIGAPHNVVGPGFRAKINAEWTKHNAPAPKEDYMAAISPEDWRHMTTGPAYAFYKNVLADDPETAPRIPLGLAIENATTAALAVKAAIENTPPEGD